MEATEVSGEGPHADRRRYYCPTAAGRMRLRDEARLLEDMVAHARAHGHLT